jgi:ribosomal protein L37AE/L43A
MTAQTILHDLAARGIILTATGDRLDVDGPDEALTDELLATLRSRKSELLELLTSGHLCPGCAGELVLQDRAADAWYCPNCRKWADGQGRALAPTEKPKTTTRAEAKARALIEDLKAAGCAFVIEDGELRLQFPSRMSSGLWTRFESAGDIFRSMAFEAAINDDAMPEDASEWVH